MSFANLVALRTYVNQYFTANGVNAITGNEDNTVLNGIIDWISNSMMNSGFVRIVTTGGAVVLQSPMTLITTTLPTSLQWLDNFQNQYYIVNGLGLNIPLATNFSYIDAFGTSQVVIPARTAIHIAKATNGTWIQMNNVGGGSGGGLPSTTGHNGQFLTNNGTTSNWSDPHITIKSANFQSDGVTYLNPDINVNYHVSIFNPAIPNFMYAETGDWQYVAGGFKMLVPWFNANTNPNIILELFFKGINTP